MTEHGISVTAPRLRMWLTIVLVVGIVQAARAELPPNAYRKMQEQAPEELKIEVLKVRATPIRERNRKDIDVQVEAKVLGVRRSNAHVHDGDVINIAYVHHRHDKGFVGPGEIPVLERGKVYPAFLDKVRRERVYKPVAGAYSFDRIGGDGRRRS